MYFASTARVMYMPEKSEVRTSGTSDRVLHCSASVALRPCCQSSQLTFGSVRSLLFLSTNDKTRTRIHVQIKLMTCKMDLSLSVHTQPWPLDTTWLWTTLQCVYARSESLGFSFGQQGTGTTYTTVFVLEQQIIFKEEKRTPVQLAYQRRTTHSDYNFRAFHVTSSVCSRVKTPSHILLCRLVITFRGA